MDRHVPYHVTVQLVERRHAPLPELDLVARLPLLTADRRVQAVRAAAEELPVQGGQGAPVIACSAGLRPRRRTGARGAALNAVYLVPSAGARNPYPFSTHWTRARHNLGSAKVVVIVLGGGRNDPLIRLEDRCRSEGRQAPGQRAGAPTWPRQPLPCPSAAAGSYSALPR